jgi:calcium/calmodulin-dependent protein kinase I
VVTSLATGGELFDRICALGKFTERDACTLINQVLSAVLYLHERRIVHRDLKPENLLYLTPDPDSALVVADFGIAKELQTETETLKAMAGSYGYAAPEILKRTGHSYPADLWSLGVICYTILCGYSPFRAEDRDELIAETCRADVSFHQARALGSR